MSGVRWLSFSLSMGLLCSAASAVELVPHQHVRCGDIPKSWQPAITFYKADQAGGSGVYFFEVSRDENKGISRIERMHVAYDAGGAGNCVYRIEHVIGPWELRSSKGYVVKQVSGRRATTLKSSDATDQGGTIAMIVLKEANAIWADAYSAPIYFSVSINSAGTVRASRRGKAFNVMKITQLWKSFPTKGTIPAGVRKIEFLNYNYNIGEDFAP